jgi:hypothetical protein
LFSFFFVAQKPINLLNTSLSLDVLDILLREKQQFKDDDIVQLSSSDSINDDDDKDVLPLPLWDRIRQRTAV